MFDIVWSLTTTSTCLINKHFLIVFNHQTFPVWTGLYDYAFDSKLSSCSCAKHFTVSASLDPGVQRKYGYL